jgi:hypothetical protein
MSQLSQPLGKPSSAATSDPAGALKKYVSKQTEECIENASRLAHDLSRSGASEAVSKFPEALAAKADIIERTGRLLEQMPPVISNLDAYLDDAIRDASAVPEVLELLQNREPEEKASEGQRDSG